MPLRLLGVSAALAAASAAPLSSNSTFVFLFEWSWSDVAQECEQWLGPKGFQAVQVSPPNEHIQGDAWWTRYQPVTYKLVSRSGDEAAFVDMVRRCKKAGVDVYVDAVINHIARGSGQGMAGSSYGNRATAIYAQEDMHHGGDLGSNCGIQDYNDAHQVQYCDLEGLPDLCTSCGKVQDTVAGYLKHAKDVGVAGFRVDAAKHMQAGELQQMLGKAPQGMFAWLEVISGAGQPITPEQYTGMGMVTEFNYARQLAPNFLAEGKLQYLKSFGQSWGFLPPGQAVTFLDNHDTQRGEAQLTYRNGRLYELANVFMLAHPYGYPVVMSSYHFDSHDQGPPGTPVHSSGGRLACGRSHALEGDGPWVCEHRWPGIANMVAWRQAAGDSPVTSFEATGGDTIVLCRGTFACVALNRQGSNAWSASIKLTLPAGDYCDVIRSDDAEGCPRVAVGADGMASIEVPPMGAVALHVGKRPQQLQVLV